MALRLSTGMRNKMVGLVDTLISNGSFTSATTGWTGVDSTLASVAGGQDGNALEITETGGVNPGKAYQDITTVIGRLYKVSTYFKKGTADNGKFMIGTTGDEDSIYDSGNLADASWTQKTIGFLATATTTRITLQTNDATAGETSLFDELVVEPVFDGVKEILRNCKIAVYTGAQPADADSAAAGTKLVTISESSGATGLTLDPAVGGAITKAAAETWQGTAVAAGVAGWFRVYEEGDDPAVASTVAARFDGSIAVAGAQLNMGNTTISLGAVQTVSNFSVSMPAQ